MKVHLLISVVGEVKKEHWYDGGMVPVPHVGNGISVDKQIYTVNGVRYEYHAEHIEVKIFI